MGIKQALRRLRSRSIGQFTIADYRAKGAQIGADVWIGSQSWLDPTTCYMISIGDGAVLAPQVTIIAHDAALRRRIGFTKVAPVTIGARVFIGARALILPGVTVGDDAVIGAGSVVTRDVPPGSVAAGNPAQVISSTAHLTANGCGALEDKPRFNEQTPGAVFASTDWPMLRRRAAEHGYIWIS